MSRSLKPALMLMILMLTCRAGELIAYPDGVTGKAKSPQGCNCHSTTPNSAGVVTVTLTGPTALKPSASAHYTLSVTGGPSGSTGGLDLTCATGSFTAGTGTRVSGQDVTHVDGTRRSWEFDWTAPVAEGIASFYAVGLASNGSGSSGDSWNWYGGAVNTAFPVQVSSTVGVGDVALALRLAPVSPNPMRAAALLAFSTTREGMVRLAVFDAQGRRAANLVAGTLPAGRHLVSWDGRGEGGRVLPGGIYFARLEAEGARLMQRVTKLD